MEPIRKSPRGSPIGYVIDHEPCFTVEYAAREILGMRPATLWGWVQQGHFMGFDLDVRQVPVQHKGHTRRTDKPRQFWVVVPKTKLDALQEALPEMPQDRGGWSGEQRQRVKAVLDRFRQKPALAAHP